MTFEDLMTTQEKTAYAAGLFDGEGCIQIYRQKNTNYFSVFAKVAMTTRQPLLFLQRLYGGSVCVRPVRGGRRPQWDWTVTGRACEQFLESVMTVLIVKGQEAALALIMISSLKRTSGRGTKLSPKVIGLRALLEAECKLFKRLKG